MVRRRNGKFFYYYLLKNPFFLLWNEWFKKYTVCISFESIFIIPSFHFVFCIAERVQFHWITDANDWLACTFSFLNFSLAFNSHDTPNDPEPSSSTTHQGSDIDHVLEGFTPTNLVNMWTQLYFILKKDQYWGFLFYYLFYLFILFIYFIYLFYLFIFNEVHVRVPLSLELTELE